MGWTKILTLLEMRRVTKHRKSSKKRALRKTRRGGVTNYPPLPASPRAGNNNNNNNRSNMSNNNNNNGSNMSNNNNNNGSNMSNNNNNNNNQTNNKTNNSTRSNLSNNNNNNGNYSNNNNSNYSNNNGKRRYRTVKQNTNLAMSLLFGKSRGGGVGVSKIVGTLAANNENNENNAPTAKPTLLVNNESLKKAPGRAPRLQLAPVHSPNNALKVANFTSFFKPGNTGYFSKPKYNTRTRDAIQGKINRQQAHTNAAASANAAAASQRGLNAFYARQKKEQAELNRVLRNAGL